MQRPEPPGPPCNRSSTRTGTEIQSQIQNKQTNTTNHTNYYYYYYYIYGALPTFEFTVYLYLTVTYCRVVMPQQNGWTSFLLSLLPLRSLLKPRSFSPTHKFPHFVFLFASLTLTFKFFFEKIVWTKVVSCFLFCSVAFFLSSKKLYVINGLFQFEIRFIMFEFLSLIDRSMHHDHHWNNERRVSV